MGRLFLTIIVPLLLPTAIYALWRVVPGKPFNLPAAWVWLVVGGLLLASLTLVLLNVDFGAPKNGQYVPPHVSDGQVVPGRVEAAPRP